LKENNMNWFEEWEQQNKVSENAAAARETTGTVQTTPKAAPKLFSRNQWKAAGRRVIVSDPQAKKIVTPRISGHTFYLFSLEQTAKWPA
jgi:hypothetical protein